MASAGKTPPPPWRRLQRFTETLIYRASSEAPKLIRQIRNAPSLQEGIQRGSEEGIKIGVDVLISGAFRSSPAIPVGRPVANTSTPTARRARKLVYAPDLNGRADPGEIVWTWVAYEDDPSHGKDRPVLVVGRDRSLLLGLMLSSQDRHEADSNWVGIGSGSWDDAGRPSWVRLDRVLDVPEEFDDDRHGRFARGLACGGNPPCGVGYVAQRDMIHAVLEIDAGH